MQSKTMIVENKRLLGILLAATLLLLVPAVAMQFSKEVKWGPGDFVIAAVLLFSTGIVFELALRKGINAAYRAGAAIAIIATLLLIWLNLAVGLIGSEGNAANLMYIGVLAVGLIGAAIARFQSRGMARAMFATAFAQLLVAAIAQLAGLGSAWILNGIFALLWFGSGLLFRHAGDAVSR